MMRSLGAALLPCLCLAFPAAGFAQVDSGSSAQQLDEAIGQRVEAFAVLSTQRAIQTGGYSFRIHDADASVNRASFVIDLAGRRPLGDTGLYWQPVVDVGVGASRFVNSFDEGQLAGSESIYNTWAISGLIGPRLYLLRNLSILPSIGVLQSYTENDFRTHTPAGEEFEAAADGNMVNWDVLSLTTIPSIEARYETTLGPVQIDLRGAYARYTTRPIYRSTDDLDFSSESASWTIRADLDYATGLELWHLPVRLGGTISRTQLLEGLQESLSTDHFYRAGPRLMFDVPGGLWVLGSFGLGYTWVWGDDFSGFDVGLELEFSL